MSSLRIYHDSDSFVGAAGVIENDTTTNGNTWKRMTQPSHGTLNRTGTGRIRKEGGISKVAQYRLRLDDAAVPTLNPVASLQQYIEMLFDGLPPGATASQTWTIGGILGLMPTVGTGWAVTLGNRTFPDTPGQAWFLGQGNFRIDASTKIIDGGGWNFVLTTAEVVTLNARLDEYAGIVRISTTSGINMKFFVPGPFTSTQYGNEQATFGLLGFSDAAAADSIAMDSVSFGYYKTTPIVLYPTWKDWGRTSVAEVGPLDMGMNVVTIVDLDDVNEDKKIGGYDIILPKVRADRSLEPKMLILNNRTNPGIVDVSIGPFVWRVSSGSEAEIPLDPAMNTDIISLRGSGANVFARIFAVEVPKTFRQ